MEASPAANDVRVPRKSFLSKDAVSHACAVQFTAASRRLWAAHHQVRVGVGVGGGSRAGRIDNLPFTKKGGGGLSATKNC